MRFFINTELNYVIITNYKVMYSTLMTQRNLINHTSTHFDEQLVVGMLQDGTVEKFILTRNPYDRVLSCYFDKFVESPKSPDFFLQFCHIIALPYFGIDITQPKEIIAGKIEKISFSEFVLTLPLFYDKEEHYIPQYSLKLIPSLRQDHIKMENILFNDIKPGILKMEDDFNFITEHLQLNFKIHRGKTEHLAFPNYYDPALYATINKLYDQDFNYFGYQKMG